MRSLQCVSSFFNVCATLSTPVMERFPYPYNNRICIPDADTGKSDVETVVIFRILFRICTHKTVQIN